eukprot:scaffold20819_cov108-Isochrysis_galbana.AAC.3
MLYVVLAAARARPSGREVRGAACAPTARAAAGCAQRARCTACAPAGSDRHAALQSTGRPTCPAARRGAHPGKPRACCRAWAKRGRNLLPS